MCIGKQWALSRAVTCNVRLYLKKGQASAKPCWKHQIFTSNYRCLHTWLPNNTAFGWDRQTVKAQCSLFTYTVYVFVFKPTCSHESEMSCVKVTPVMAYKHVLLLICYYLALQSLLRLPDIYYLWNQFG